MLKKFVLWLKYQVKLLPYRPRLFWKSLWVREDEFHNSLNMNTGAMFVMQDKDRDKYSKNLVLRRSIAHNRSLEEGTHKCPWRKRVAKFKKNLDF